MSTSFLAEELRTARLVDAVLPSLRQIHKNPVAFKSLSKLILAGPSCSERVSTYQALRRLESLGLVESRMETGKHERSLRKPARPYRRRVWQLTTLGQAVVRAYREELVGGKEIRWDAQRLQIYLEG